MRFEYPHLLWCLLAVPALILFFRWSWRTRKRLIAQFVQSRLLAHLTVGVSARRQKMRMAILVLVVTSVLLALARPQWGYHWEEARQRGLDIIVAIDTSRSMLAADLAPNRLARAKLAALDLKRLANSDRVGLIAFAGSAFLQCPLSFDDEAFRQNVNALDVSIIPQGGTALAEAIQCAQAAFKEKSDNHKILVLFSDGEDHDGKALESARDAAKEGLRIFTVGVGTPNGELLRATDAKGQSDYIRDDQGNVVKSRLNERLLRDLAQAGDGFYLLLTGANTMEMLYERGLAPLPKAEFSARRLKRFHERYQWFLGAAMVLLVLEMLLPERKRVPRTAAITAASNPELRQALTLLALAFLSPSLAASPAKAWKAYETGHFQSARREYEQSLEKKPNDARLHFNAGAAAYQAKDYETALSHLNSALMTPDVPLQQRAYYNRGNAQFRLGEENSDLKQRQESWEEALASFESALKLNPQDADAKFNLELIKRKLEELKKQQEQQQQQQPKDNSKDDSKKDDKQPKQDKPDSKPDTKQDPKKDQQQQNQQPTPQDSQQPEQPKQQPSKPEQKPNEQKPAESKSAEPKEKEDQSDPAQPGQAMRALQMTPQQAHQLLDAQKSDEKAMIFIPRLRTNRNERVFKDW